MLSRAIRRNTRSVSLQARAFSGYAVQYQQSPITPPTTDESKELKKTTEINEKIGSKLELKPDLKSELKLELKLESSNFLNELLKEKTQNESTNNLQLNSPEILQTLESLLPDSLSIETPLPFTDRNPASYPTKDRLPRLPEILNNETTNKYIEELTHSSFIKQVDVVQAKKLLLTITNAALVEKNNDDENNLGNLITKNSALHLIDYLCLIKYYDLVEKLRNKYIDNSDKLSTLNVFESLFYRFDSINNKKVFIDYLNDLNKNQIKLSELLIYRIYQSFKNDELLQETFLNLLKKKNLPINLIFENEFELKKIRDLNEFNKFINEKQIDIEKNIEIKEFKFKLFLKLGLIDDFLKLCEKYPDYKLSRETLEYVTESFLKQDRLNECWYFFKANYKLNKRRCKQIMNHLNETNQQYFILPFAEVVKKNPGYNLFAAGWQILLNQRKSTFKTNDDKSNSWWLLSNSLVQISASAKDDRIKPFSSKLIEFVKNSGTEWDPLNNKDDMTNDEKIIDKNLKRNLHWKMNNPNFNLGSNSLQFKKIAELFNPEIKSNEVLKINELLSNDELNNALNYINTITINKYHIYPIVEYLTLKKDLIGLINFINEIESKTLLKIKFDALSQFASKIVNVKFAKNLINLNPEENVKKLNLIYNYLYNKTNLNASVWGSNIMKEEFSNLNIKLRKLEQDELNNDKLSESLDILLIKEENNEQSV